MRGHTIPLMEGRDTPFSQPERRGKHGRSLALTQARGTGRTVCACASPAAGVTGRAARGGRGRGLSLLGGQASSRRGRWRASRFGGKGRVKRAAMLLRDAEGVKMAGGGRGRPANSLSYKATRCCVYAELAV